MNRARVARIITRLNIGGPSIQAISLSRELEPYGFDTCLIHGRLGEDEGDMTTLMPLGRTRSRYLRRLVRPISPIRDALALCQLFRELRQWQPDIVHTHMAKAGALGRLAGVFYNWSNWIAGSARRARLVHTYHGHVFEGYFGSWSTRLFLLVERWLGRRTDALIAISRQVRQDLLQTYHIGTDARVRLIPLGFDLDRLGRLDDADHRQARTVLEIPRDALVITTVGRLTAIKQHSLFLEVAALLAGKVPEALFLIVGDGELRAELDAQVVRSGLAGRVRLLGWRGDLDSIYAATDVFVLTSRNEGTPVALIEAMASAVASVSTDVGGVRDVIADAGAGTLVPLGDAGALSDAVMRYIASPELRMRVGAAARASALARFNVCRLVEDVAGLYDELLRGSR